MRANVLSFVQQFRSFVFWCFRRLFVNIFENPRGGTSRILYFPFWNFTFPVQLFTKFLLSSWVILFWRRLYFGGARMMFLRRGYKILARAASCLSCILKGIFWGSLAVVQRIPFRRLPWNSRIKAGNPDTPTQAGPRPPQAVSAP